MLGGAGPGLRAGPPVLRERTPQGQPPPPPYRCPTDTSTSATVPSAPTATVDTPTVTPRAPPPGMQGPPVGPPGPKPGGPPTTLPYSKFNVSEPNMTQYKSSPVGYRHTINHEQGNQVWQQ